MNMSYGVAAESAETELRAPVLYRAAHEIVVFRNLSQPCVLRVRSRQRLEILRRVPHPRLLAIQVCEHAQDAPASRRPAGKRVHVQQIVPLVQRQPAPFFLDRTEACKVQRPSSGVG